MNTISAFNNRFRRSSINHTVAVLLIALAWSSIAFCGEIHEAAANGDLEKVKALLKADPGSVSNTDNFAATPLHLAVAYERKEIAELLLAAKAPVNAKDKQGDTPLHYAALLVRKDMTELLLSNGADVSAKDKKGQAPLDVAVARENKAVAELLRQHGKP